MLHLIFRSVRCTEPTCPPPLRKPTPCPSSALLPLPSLKANLGDPAAPPPRTRTDRHRVNAGKEGHLPGTPTSVPPPGASPPGQSPQVRRIRHQEPARSLQAPGANACLPCFQGSKKSPDLFREHVISPHGTWQNIPQHVSISTYGVTRSNATEVTGPALREPVWAGESTEAELEGDSDGR